MAFIPNNGTPPKRRLSDINSDTLASASPGTPNSKKPLLPHSPEKPVLSKRFYSHTTEVKTGVSKLSRYPTFIETFGKYITSTNPTQPVDDPAIADKEFASLCKEYESFEVNADVAQFFKFLVLFHQDITVGNSSFAGWQLKYSCQCMRNVINSLIKFNDPKIQEALPILNKFCKILEALGKEHEVVSNLKTQSEILSWSQKQMATIWHLKPNESHYLPSGWSDHHIGHAMIERYHCQTDRNLAKTLYNTGDGANYHVQEVDSRKIRGVRSARFPNLSRQDLFFSEKFLEADPSMLIANGEIINPQSGRVHTFGSDHVYLKAHSHIREHFTEADGRARTLQRGGSCPLEVLLAILDDLFNESKLSPQDKKPNDLYVYIKYRIKLATLTAFYIKWDPLIKQLQEQKDIESVETVMLMSSYKLLRSSRKLLHSGVINLDLSTKGYILGKKISEKARKYIDDRNKQNELQTETYRFEETSVELFPGTSACCTLTKHKKTIPANFQFPMLGILPEPENIASSLEDLLNFLGPQASKPVGDPQIENDLLAIEHYIARLPVPKARNESEYWNKIPAADLRKCLSGLSRLMDQYSCLFFSLTYPALSQQSKLDRISDLRHSHHRNIFLKLIAITHHLSVRQDDEWRKLTPSLKKNFPPLSIYKIAVPHFGYVENEIRSMNGDRYQIFTSIEEFSTQVELKNYFEEWNGKNPFNQDALFDVWDFCSTSLDSIEKLKLTQDYKYFKKLLSLLPQLSKYTEQHTRIKNVYNYPTEVILPLELMLDTGASMHVPMNMGDSSQKFIESPLNHFDALHLAVLRKAYTLFFLTQFGEVKFANVDFRNTHVSMLVSNRSVYLFGNGIYYYPWNDSTAKLPYADHVEKATVNFIESSLLNRRELQVSISCEEEALQISTRYTTQIGTTSNLRALFRTWFTPNVQPSLVLDNFQEVFDELGNPSVQYEFMTLLFKDCTMNYQNGDAKHFHFLFQQLKNNQQFVNRLSNFLNSAIQFHLKKSISSFNSKAILFVIKVATLIRISNLVEKSLIDDEKQTLELVSKKCSNDPKLLGAVYLLSFIHLLTTYSSQGVILESLVLYALYKTYGIDRTFRSVDLENWANTKFCEVLPEIESMLEENTNIEMVMCHIADVLKISGRDNHQVTIKNGIARFIVLNVEKFSLDLTTFQIYNPDLIDDSHPGWSQSKFHKILNYKKYPLVEESGKQRFEHPLFKQLCFVPDDSSPGLYFLQLFSARKWYTYLDPEICITDKNLATSKLPVAFWLKYSLWAADFEPSLILDLKTGETVWKFGIGGDFKGPKDALCCDIYLNDSPLKRYLEKFENISLILIYKNRSGKISEIDFVCCKSPTMVGLTFKLIGDQLIWTQNPKYRLAEKRPLGLLGTIDDYLYLEAIDGSNPKILVSKKFNKRDPDKEDYTQRAALRKAREDNYLEIIKAKSDSLTIFFDYEVNGNELVSNTLEGKLNLVYLYAIQSDFKKAISILKKISSLEDLNDTSTERLEDTIFYDGFEDPNLYAVQMHLVLIFLENYKRHTYTSSNIDKYILVYAKYLNTLNNIPPDYQLKKEPELFILSFMNAGTEDALHKELFNRRKAELTGNPVESPYFFKPKLSDVLTLSFGKISDPLTQELIDKIPLARSYNTTLLSLLDPSSITEDFYYWYHVAIDVSSDAVQKKRLLKYRLGLLARPDNASFVTDLQYILLEYLRVVVLRPEGFSKSSIMISSRMGPWFQALHAQYLVAVAELTKSAETISNVPENPQLIDSMVTDDWAINRKRHVFIEDLDEYNLNDFRDLFEIPDNPPLAAPKLFLFDVNELTEEQLPYQNAIKAEFDKFQADFEAGYNQIHNARKFLLSGEFSALVQKLKDKQDLFKSHFTQLVETALKYAKSPSLNPREHLLQILGDASLSRQEVTFERLVGCLLIKDWTLLKTRSAHLTPVQIDDVHKLTLQAVWIGVHIQSLARCIALTNDKADIPLTVQKIGEELFVRRSYPPQKYPSILAQEYLKGIKLRTYQGEFLDNSLKTTKGKGIESYISGVFQVPPGGGKSSELAPQLGFQAANGSRLALFLALPTQYETLKNQIPKSQMEYFGQETDCISYHRENLTSDNIRKILTMLNHAIIRKRLVLMPSDFPSILFVHWIDLMIKEAKNFTSGNHVDGAELTPIQESIVDLKEIFKILDLITDTVGDEADLFLSILHEVNIMVDQESVPLSWLALVKKVYQLVILDPQIRKVLNETNNFRLISTDKYKKQILLHLVLIIFEDELSKLVPLTYHEACKEYLQDAINPEFEKYIDSPEPPNLENVDKVRIEFLRWLKVQTSVPHLDKFSLADYIAVIRHILNGVIVNNLKKIPNRHYGWVKNNSAIGPYKAADSPTTNNFGYVFDELSFYFQIALTKPIPFEYFEHFVKQQVALSEKIAAASRIKPAETLIGKKLKKLLGADITDLSKNGLQRALKYVNVDPLKRIEILSDLAKMQVKYQTAVVSSNSINQAHRFNTLRTISGTPSNYHSFPSVISKNYHADKGSEGRIAEVLIRKSSALDKHIYIIESTNLTSVLTTLKKEHPRFTSIHVISDPLGIFSSSAHYDNILSLYKFFKEEGDSRIKAILTFFKSPGTEESLIPGLFRIDTGETIVLNGTNEKDFKEIGYRLEDIFYYIPENQSTGFHADMPPNCIHFETLGEDETQRTIFQGALRSRLVHQTQTVEYLVLKSAVANFPKLGTSIHQNIRQGLINQGIDISKQVLAMFTIAPSKEPSVLAVKEIVKAQSYSEIMTSFVGFKESFITSTRIEPYKMFGALAQNEHPRKIIKPSIEQALERWSKALPELKDRLAELYLNAKKSVYLPSTTKKNNAQRMGIQTQNQNLVQSQSQVQSQIKTEMMMYKSQEKEQNLYSEYPWTLAQVEEFLKEGISAVEIVPLSEHLTRTQELYPHKYSAIFDPEIRATVNFLHTYENFYPIFHEDQKPGTQILIHEMPYSATFLSLNESSSFKKVLPKYYKDLGVAKVFLITSDGQPFLSLHGDTPPLTGQFLRLLIQINFFNGNLLFLEKHSAATLEWLNEKNTELKIHFLKIKVEEKPFLKELLQNGNFKHLL